jgi:hypothetical protein
MVYIRFKNERGAFDYFVGASRKDILDDTGGGTEFSRAKLVGPPEEIDSERAFAAALQAGGANGLSGRRLLELGVESIRAARSKNFYLFTVQPA